jgi:hypothetical protein
MVVNNVGAELSDAYRLADEEFGFAFEDSRRVLITIIPHAIYHFHSLRSIKINYISVRLPRNYADAVFVGI